MIIRPAGPQDLESLRDLCLRSILETGRAWYAPRELEAWASFARDPDRFRSFVLENRTLVAVRDEVPAGFAGMGADGYVASVYVAPECARQGVARALMERLLAEQRAAGIHRFHAHASRAALPLFESLGFGIVGEEVVVREGIPLLRYEVVREERST